MQYQSKSVPASTKALVAILVITGLAALVGIATRASHEATLAKAHEFEASAAIQTAAREKKGSKLAATTKE